MKIDIKYVHMDQDGEIRDYAAEKIGKLDKYYKNIVSTIVTLEKHSGDTADVRYGVRAELAVPGKKLFAEEYGKDIKTVIDKIEKVLKEQLIKEKERKSPNKIHKARAFFRGFFGRE